MLDSRAAVPSMLKVLIISASDLRADLGRTVLWRNDIERAFAPDLDAAIETMRALVPNLVVLDAAPPDAPGAIRRLREDPDTRPAAIAAVSRHPFLADADLLRAAGANVVIPLQADPALWDARLDELLQVPRRREARIPVPAGDLVARLRRRGRGQGQARSTSASTACSSNRPVPLEVGPKLDLRFRLPGHDGELQALGEVVRQDDRPRSGIKFLVLRGDAREAIRRLRGVGGGAVRPARPVRPSEESTEGTEWEAALTRERSAEGGHARSRARRRAHHEPRRPHRGDEPGRGADPRLQPRADGGQDDRGDLRSALRTSIRAAARWPAILATGERSHAGPAHGDHGPARRRRRTSRPRSRSRAPT